MKGYDLPSMLYINCMQVPPTAFASNAIVPVNEGAAALAPALDIKPPSTKIW
jgi:hypothetical protein